jgi:hypothetical protein
VQFVGYLRYRQIKPAGTVQQSRISSIQEATLTASVTRRKPKASGSTERLCSVRQSSLVHLEEDNDQRKQGERFDEGQTQHQQQLDAGASPGVPC